MPARHPLNVLGPFYVVDGCCTLCGVPDGEAPELFGVADRHCYVQRQPADERELARMLNAIAGAEFQCIRYGGSDPGVRARIAALGEPGLCDPAPG